MLEYIEKIILGQQDDARMNLAVALTASRHGATVVNHVTVINLLKGLNRVGAFCLVKYCILQIKIIKDYKVLVD
jgi:hypothetical protein